MLLIQNISGGAVDLNDLGFSIASAEIIDLALEANAQDVVASAQSGGDLSAAIIAGTVIVKDPFDGVTNLSAANSILAAAAHNDTHYRMPIAARIADAIDVDLTAAGSFLRFTGTNFVRQTPAQVAGEIESEINIANTADFANNVSFANLTDVDLTGAVDGTIFTWDGTTFAPNPIVLLGSSTSNCSFETINDLGQDWCNWQIGEQGSAFMISKRSRGTIDNVLPLEAGVKVGGYAWIAEDGEPIPAGPAGSPGYVNAELQAHTTEDQTATSGGTEVRIVTTPNGTKSTQTVAIFGDDGDITLPAYPSTRNDGATTTALYVDVDGVVQHGPISATSGGTPAAPANSIQYNNSGSFGGDAVFTYNSLLSRVEIDGTDGESQLTIGGTTRIDNGQTSAPLYVQVDGDAQVDAFQAFFQRSVAGISGWITFSYDGAKPTLCLVDEDDDSPDIKFQVIGSGTDAAPEFSNTFGGRGQLGNATDGFEWRENDRTVATLETGVMDVIGPDAEYRVNGAPLMRPTFPIFAEESGAITVGGGNEFSFGNGAVNSANDANPSGILLGVNCTLIGIGVSGRNSQNVAASASISVLRNGTVVATGGIATAPATTGAECKLHTDVVPDTVNFAPGDTLQFLTASETGTLNAVRVVAWFERTS